MGDDVHRRRTLDIGSKYYLAATALTNNIIHTLYIYVRIYIIYIYEYIYIVFVYTYIKMGEKSSSRL